MKLFAILAKQLKKEKDFISGNKEIKKRIVIHQAQNFDASLIELLLDDKDLKAKFFIEVKGILVFNQNLFVQFLEQKNYLNDSYTQYKNKVGLTIDGKHFKQCNEVALVWPFKDCILEGGQSRESDKRDEIFFNEILAQDEITQLLEPKVLTGAKVYNKDGEQDFKKFSRDAKINEKRGLPANTITDNLIIKGNNLLALHSLKKEFAGKIKLIYIDPPYNTGNDGFKYNDNFNHSTWLTFMKNRLTVARELLKDDGVIFVQCDDNEQAYLKVLMDEVFDRENFLNTILVKVKVNAGVGGSGENKKLRKNIENLNFFCKNKSQFTYNPLYKNEKITEYIAEHKRKNVGFYYTRVLINEGQKSFYKEVEGIKIYKHTDYKFDTIANIVKRENLSLMQVYVKYFNTIFMVTNAQTPKLAKVNDEVREKQQLISYKYISTKKNQNKETTKYIWNKTLVVWFADSAISKNDTVFKKKEIGTLWDDISWGRLDLEGSVNLKNGKKPEKLIQRIVELATKKDDLVLDYHLGSGTTAAVAHKMGRQYIGIEQMDYIETHAVARLKTVITGKQDGISKSEVWQGGGAFTYLELKKYNQTFIEQIEKAKDSKSLLKIWEKMKAKSFLHYNVDLQKQEEHIKEFKQLELSQQKEHLIELLDKNQLYVNLSAINDQDFGLSEAEKQLTKDFFIIENGELKIDNEELKIENGELRMEN